MRAARPSVFNDISRDKNLTLISVFKQPHLVSFRIKSKVRPKKYRKLVRFMFHFFWMCSTYQHAFLQQTWCQCEHRQLKMCLRKLWFVCAPCVGSGCGVLQFGWNSGSQDSTWSFMNYFNIRQRRLGWNLLKSKFSWSIENPQSSAHRDIPWVHADAESSGWTLFGITLKDLQ